MNREIKFRVWDYQNNRWAKDNTELKCSMGLEFGVKDYFDNIAGEKSIRWDFQQYTGLKDKNGVEIYEGDILKPKSYHPVSPIFWMNGSWKVQGRHSKIGIGSWANLTEVIGNIHENPELCK